MTDTETFHFMDALSADFSMLQLQLGITNSSNLPTTGNWTIEDSDVLLDALLQQKAAVAKAWVALMTIVSEEHEVHLPFWAIIGGLVLIGALLFYLVNYMLWAKRENAARMHDLEDAKKHSEHGTLVGLKMFEVVSKNAQSHQNTSSQQEIQILVVGILHVLRAAP